MPVIFRLIGKSSPPEVTPPSGSPDFTFIDRQSDVDAWQGAAFDGQFYYTTAYRRDDNRQWWLTKYDADFNIVIRRNLGPEAAGLHLQINGLTYDESSGILYVCANNYPTTPERGWVMEVDTSDLSVSTFTELSGAKWTEAIFLHDGSWWEVNATGHEIREFNLSFALQNTFALPDTTPNGLFWQAIFVHDNVYYVNLHEDADDTRLRSYTFSGSAFVKATDTEVPPSADATQGMFYNQRFIYWSERDSPAQEGHIARTTVVDGLVLDGIPYLEARDGEAYAGFTIAAINGTGPFVYSIAFGSLPSGITLNTSSGVVSGTPTVDGTFAGIILRVTDDVAATSLMPAFTLEVYPSSLSNFNATVSASDIDARLYGFPLSIDLSDMPAAFWTDVDADGGDIRAYGGHGLDELPLDMVVIDTGAETGFIVVKTDLNDVTSTIIRIALDGGGLRAASHEFGRYNVWPAWRYEAVYAFIGDLTDRTENANTLTVTIGSASYGTGGDAPGIGGGLDTSGASFAASNTSMTGAPDLVWPFTMMVSLNRRTETTQNQLAMCVAQSPTDTTNRAIALGEQHATDRWTYFADGPAWDDSDVPSTLNQDKVLHGLNIRGDEEFYVDGVLKTNPTSVPAIDTTDDTIIIGNAASASHFRGDIGMAYLAKEQHSAAWCKAESKMLLLNSTFVPVT